jgi:glycosyltransferase involved in cell wall biosynthesis
MLEKKRVAVVTSDVPFVEGGHITIAESTVKALAAYGYEADLILTPQNRFGRQISAYMATRLTDVGEDGLGRKIHQVISFRYPSFAAKHPFHVCWLNHRLREYYDLWGAFSSHLGLRAKLKESLRRRFIHLLDAHLLRRNVTKVYAQSKTVQQRLKVWGDIPSEVLYPPPPQRDYRTDSYQNFILSVSRLQKLKRLDLLLEALPLVKNRDLRVTIIGEGPEERRLASRIKENRLENRVMLLGKTDEKSLVEQYSRCLAVFFAPLGEDYGLVTAEAFASRKPVVTTLDSGGHAELVEDGERGYVCQAHPERIAEKLDELAENRILAEQMGEKAYAFISQMTWEKAVGKLLICG